MLKNLNLKMKMLLSIGMIAFFSFAVTIGVVTVKSGRMARKDAMEGAVDIANRYGGMLKADVELAMDASRTLAQTFEGLKKSGRMPERGVLDQVIQQVLIKNPSFLSVWTCWEPNALDGNDAAFSNAPGHDATGRYVPCWSQSGGNMSVEPLAGYEWPGEGDYYLIPRRMGEETVMEPYLYSVGGREMLITSLCVPIDYKGKVVGVVGIDMSLAAFDEAFSSVKISETGYINILSNAGTLVTHPNAGRIGEPLVKSEAWASKFLEDIRSGKGGVTTNSSEKLGGEIARIFAPVQIGKSKTPWAVMVSIPMSTVLKEAKNIEYVSIGIGSVAMLVLMGALILIVNNITGPLNKGVALAEVMATGDFSQSLDIRQNDEVGKLIDSLNNLTSNLGGMLKEISGGVETLTSSSTDLAAISEQMSQGAGETSEKSGTVAAAVEEMSSSMNSVASAMEQASTNVSMVATASEEMTATINEVAKNTESARSIAGTAVSQAKIAYDQISELGTAAREIGQVTETITDISEQTNLLALNATIEAARAGEAGKGFAVVATEIKELARLTSEATNDIRTKIEGIQQATSVSVSSIEAITKVIDEISEIVSTTAAAIEEQAVTTQEIAENVAQVSQGLSEINENVAQSSRVAGEVTLDVAEVSRKSEEMTNSSTTVSTNAGGLLNLAEDLRAMVTKFKV